VQTVTTTTYYTHPYMAGAQGAPAAGAPAYPYARLPAYAQFSPLPGATPQPALHGSIRLPDNMDGSEARYRSDRAATDYDRPYSAVPAARPAFDERVLPYFHSREMNGRHDHPMANTVDREIGQKSNRVVEETLPQSGPAGWRDAGNDPFSAYRVATPKEVDQVCHIDYFSSM